MLRSRYVVALFVNRVLTRANAACYSAAWLDLAYASAKQAPVQNMCVQKVVRENYSLIRYSIQDTIDSPGSTLDAP